MKMALSLYGSIQILRSQLQEHLRAITCVVIPVRVARSFVATATLTMQFIAAIGIDLNDFLCSACLDVGQADQVVDLLAPVLLSFAATTHSAIFDLFHQGLVAGSNLQPTFKSCSAV